MSVPMLAHADAVDLLELAILIYDYDKDFLLKTSERENNIEAFSDCKQTDKLDDVRKKAVMSSATKVPDSKIIDFISDAETDLQVGVATNDVAKRIIIVFRGSESKLDLIYDLKVLKRNIGNDIYVHNGFYEQLHTNDNYDKITNVVTELLKQHDDYTVYVTGHSLGGALSTLYGYQLSKCITQNVIIASFASPRVGDAKFKSDFDNCKNLTHYRFTNHRDVVTSTPTFFYKHVGQSIQLSNNSYKFCPNYNYSIWTFSLFVCYKVSEHYCDLYHSRLKNNVW
jgi:hypothetical protein